MDPVAITVGLSWVFLSVLCIALAVPLMRGKVPPNAAYGMRIPASFRSEAAWFAINRFGGRQLALWAVPMLLVGVVSLFLPLKSHTALTLALGFAPLIFVLIPLALTLRFAKRFELAAAR